MHPFTQSRAAFLLALVGALAGEPETRSSGSSGPILRIDEPSFDWGTAVEGDRPRHEFTLHNDGTEVLLIEQVKPACGCTTVEFSESIAPGGTGTVTLELDTANLRSRNVYKVATVLSNDPEHPAQRLVIGGALVPIVEFSPNDVVLAGRYSELKRTTVFVGPGAGTSLRILAARPMAGHVTVAEVREVGSEGRHEIDLTAAPVERAADVRDVLELRVVDAGGVERTRRIPVAVRHRARVYTDSSALVFPRASTAERDDDGALATRSVVLSAEGDGVDFTVTGVELLGLPEGSFEASVESLEPGRRYRVRLACLRAQDSALVQGKLRILTDDDEVASLELPILAQFDARTERAPEPPRAR